MTPDNQNPDMPHSALRQTAYRDAKGCLLQTKRQPFKSHGRCTKERDTAAAFTAEKTIGGRNAL